ncbi:MAG: preprotein translocase subunit SecA [Candidatus Paceibacterota bacterium]|jgi:preprotein translocase subunit SecA
MNIITKIFGSEHDKYLKSIQPLVNKINELEKDVEKFTDEQLKDKTVELKKRLGDGATLDELLPEAFALVREASKRTLKQRHFDVQLIGGIALHQGKIAEMRTGEGKTLVATLPVCLNALTGRGVHLVTVNDYLARRDAVWMGQIYAALGLTIACVNHDSSFIYDPTHQEKDDLRDEVGSFKVVYEFLRPVTRKEAYEADITYGTNSEFGFDYLRDHLVYDAPRVAQRKHYFAVVDEVDSILIDESRTPLIISAPYADSEALYQKFAGIAQTLTEVEDYTVDEKLKAIQVTDAGITKAEKALGIDNMYTEGGIKYVHHLETAVRAKALYIVDREYVVKDGEVIIVDESTGRLQPGRRWSEGLHQAIEAKEGVKVQQESRTFASITYQNYFRQYEKLAGMTGTALTSKEEFYKVYGLDVIPVPTNREAKRKDHNDLVFQSEMGKYKAVAAKIKELHEKGQPVLVGTVSIEKNELLSAFLTKEGIKHELLNAKNHEKEGEIIAQAGRPGSVVIATNMAGRGVDIMLGGMPKNEEEYEKVKSAGGLYVLGTERHDARRIDNQLRGRSGRQGDPGETQFYLSLEDSLMRIFAPDFTKKMMNKLGIPEDEPIEFSMVSRNIEAAQAKIEGLNFDARKHLLEYDDVMNHHRKVIYDRRQKVLFATLDEMKDIVADITLGDEEIQKVIDEKVAKISEEGFYNVMRQVILQTIDMLWVDHLETMDYMRSSVRLRAYGQRDPLVEYKREGLRLFRELEESWRGEVVKIIPGLGAGEIRVEQEKLEEVHESANEITGASKPAISAPESKHLNKDGTELGRNDPCYCGSGKKFKKCHGA